MAKFPEPPSAASLAARVLPDVKHLPAGTELWRIYFRRGPHSTAWNQFRSFGPVSTGRFDHHDPPPRVQERMILYAALCGPTCLAEVFQETRVVDRRRNDPWLVSFALDSPLELLDLAGNWPTRAGASMAINTAQRARARRWARVIYEAYPGINGLFYPSSMDANRPAVALFERAVSAVPVHLRFHRALAEPPLFIPIVNAAARLGYRVV